MSHWFCQVITCSRCCCSYFETFSVYIFSFFCGLTSCRSSCCTYFDTLLVYNISFFCGLTSYRGCSYFDKILSVNLVLIYLAFYFKKLLMFWRKVVAFARKKHFFKNFIFIFRQIKNLPIPLVVAMNKTVKFFL